MRLSSRQRHSGTAAVQYQPASPLGSRSCALVQPRAAHSLRRAASLLCLWLCALCCTAGLSLAPTQAAARPQTLAQLADILNKLVSTEVSYGAIPTLYRPQYNRVLDADLSMSQEDVVFVVELPGGPRIYPQRYMVWHQVVNELIDDVAYAITYCPITGTLMAFDASFGGMNLIFDLEGRLYDGNSVLIDRQTGSLWLQELGMAFDGQLLGRGMPTLPVHWTTWGAVKRALPEAPVMAQPQGNRPYSRDPYGSYLKEGTYYDNDLLAYPVRYLDRRFHRKTSMLCLEYEGSLLGIDVKYVKKKGAVNFFVGPAALLAVHDPKLDVVRVYNRQLWAEPFLFVYQYGKLTDLTTRSVWDPATGVAIEGNMKGASMKQFYGSYSMWLAWYSMNPETLVIPGPGEVPAELLSLSAPGAQDNAGQNRKADSAPAPQGASGLPPQNNLPRQNNQSAAPGGAFPQNMLPAGQAQGTLPMSPPMPVPLGSAGSGSVSGGAAATQNTPAPLR